MSAKLHFNDLPIELFVEVFKNLKLNDIAFRYLKICTHWRGNIALHMLAPEIGRQARSNPNFKKLIKKKGWTDDCEDVELLVCIYNQTMNPITSELLCYYLLLPHSLYVVDSNFKM